MACPEWLAYGRDMHTIQAQRSGQLESALSHHREAVNVRIS